ncbi:MAG TPA: flippase [Candidatus Gracilibacteria bacterium]|nr:flippase [Candidatus Gracilibacteria bacterium]
MESSLQKIRKNFSYLFVAEIAIRAMMLILTIYLAQRYSPEKLGIYALALSVGNLFEIIFNMGLGIVFLQRVSAHWEKAEEELSHFLPLRMVLSLLSFASLVIMALLLNKNAETFASIVLAGLHYSLLSLAVFLWAIFDARQKMAYTATAKLMIYPLIFVLGLYFISVQMPIWSILGTFVIGIIISLIFTITIIQKNFCRIKLNFNTKKWSEIIREGWPIALAGTFVFVYNYLDTIIISITKNEAAVGLYHAGYKITGTIFILANLVNQAYFPPLVKAKDKANGELKEIFTRALGTALFWSIPITLGGILLADRIILFIYGPAYAGSITAFKILMTNCIIFFLSSAMINFMYSLGKQKKVIKIFFAGALANTVCNIFVIPIWGIEGAATTTMLAELIVLFGIFFLVKKNITFSIARIGWKSGAGGIVMAAALWYIQFESLILTIAFGALVYFAACGLLSRAHLKAGLVSLKPARRIREESLPKENP